MNKIKKDIAFIDQHDELGMWGKHGGTFCGESLKKPIEELTKAFEKLRNDRGFLDELEYYRKNYIGRPTPFLELPALTKHFGGAKILVKHEAQAYSGSHKINNAIVHAMIAKAMGKKEIVGDTGAGYAGSALAIAASFFQLKAKVFMGRHDMERQKIQVFRMRSLGCEVVPCDQGSKTLVEAVSSCIRYFTANSDRVHMCVGSCVSSTIWVKICAWAQSIIGEEMEEQMINMLGKVPDKLNIVCAIGGGSSSYGAFNNFIPMDHVTLTGVEAGGPQGKNKGADSLSRGSIGVLHGSKSYLLQDKNSMVSNTTSISAGLDYPSNSPLHSHLKDLNRLQVMSVSDEEVLESFKLVSRLTGLQPSLEPCHSFAAIAKLAPKSDPDSYIATNCCGNALKDMSILAERLKLD